MNQLQLPVDVHFVVEEDGTSSLLVGGYAMPFPAAKLSEVLSSQPLRQGRRKVTKPPPKPKRRAFKVIHREKTKSGPTKQNKSPEWIRNIAEANRRRAAERVRQGLCLRCENKPKDGMKLCGRCIDKTSKAAIAARKAA